MSDLATIREQLVEARDQVADVQKKLDAAWRSLDGANRSNFLVHFTSAGNNAEVIVSQLDGALAIIDRELKRHAATDPPSVS